MNIHEYQAKQLLAKYGVNVPAGRHCQSLQEARHAAKELLDQGHSRLVIKTQIHAGGRGKGKFTDGFEGGVKLCDGLKEAEEIARAMLGNTLVTKQTGPEGRKVNTLLISSAEEIVKEYYLAVLLDRASSKPLMMASTEGGMDIEEVAERTPEKIFKEVIDPVLGMQPYQARKMAALLGFHGPLLRPATTLLLAVYRTWWECDASLVEINPLCRIKTKEGQEDIAAVDAKITVDDNALYRHPEIQEMRDLAEEAELEIEASKYDLNYIKLDGDIACMVNGAGLAMATMDIIQHYGGNPANFLDVGGGASKEQVGAAFKIILSDTHVRAILVNIFGGIMQCDVIAEGIVEAVREAQLRLPLVVRLEGNNVELGRRILAESGMKITTGESMADAARKVVQAAQS